MSKFSFGSKDKCFKCQKTVYPDDKITIDNVIWHGDCFRCSKCNTRLKSSTFACLEKTYYCKPHYKEAFKLKGKYDFGKKEEGSASAEEAPTEHTEKQTQKKMNHKIIIAGPPGSGKGTQCELLVKKYGIVHISTGDLVRAELKKQNEWAEKASKIMNSGLLLPDEMINPILYARLQQEDVKQRGFLLDGFPRTPSNREYLKTIDVHPTLFLILDVSDELSIARQSGRITDPVTGTVYHELYNPPPTEEIRLRCTKRATDNEEKAKVRIAVYHQEMADADTWYPKEITHVLDGSKDSSELLQHISKLMENPSPAAESVNP